MLLGSDGTGQQSEVAGRVDKLHRIEVAALITTAAKFAKAVEIIERIEEMLDLEM